MHPDTVNSQCRDYTKTRENALAARRREATLACLQGQPPAQEASGAGIATTARIGFTRVAASLSTKPYDTVRASSAVS